MTHTILLLAVLAVGCGAHRPSPVTFPLAGPSLAPNWIGEYACGGVTSEGRTYANLPLSIRASGDAYNFAWHLPGGVVSVGIALPLDSILVVAFFTGQTFGPAIYRWEEGMLVGRWTAWGVEGETYAEVCHPNTREARR